MKPKAWQIYLICVGVAIPIIIVLYNMGYGTGQGLFYDIESGVAQITLYGGIITGIYYLYKRVKKKSL